MKGQNKTSEKELNKTNKYLPDKWFKRMVIKMLTEVRRTMHEQSENFNKEKENISTKNKSQPKNSITTKKFKKRARHYTR